MNTALCSLCSQSVPLDDSGRLMKHPEHAVSSIVDDALPACEGSGSFPQAPDGPEKAEPDEPSLAVRMTALFEAKDAKLQRCIAYAAEQESLLAQAREKIAELEKDKERINALESIRDKVAFVLYDNDAELWLIYERPPLSSSAPGPVMAGDPDLRSALDAARDKKGTE